MKRVILSIVGVLLVLGMVGCGPAAQGDLTSDQVSQTQEMIYKAASITEAAEGYSKNPGTYTKSAGEKLIAKKGELWEDVGKFNESLSEAANETFMDTEVGQEFIKKITELDTAFDELPEDFAD